MINITFSGLSFRFGSEQVIDRLSLEIPAGRHTVLKGASGSGKSTILKLLLGFHKAESGSIAVKGQELDPPSLRRQTAWLPQDLNLGEGSVREVIGKPFAFEANRDGKPAFERQAETLRDLGLAPGILPKPFRDLSTGQRQRVGLAICHLLDKPLLLLDEPTSALDEQSKQKAAKLLLAQANKTVVSTSHDPFWVQQADNLIDLDNGDY